MLLGHAAYIGNLVTIDGRFDGRRVALLAVKFANLNALCVATRKSWLGLERRIRRRVNIALWCAAASRLKCKRNRQRERRFALAQLTTILPSVDGRGYARTDVIDGVDAAAARSTTRRARAPTRAHEISM